MEVTISLLFALAASVAAVEALDRETALIAFSAAGIGLALSFLLAGAPLVALLLLIAEVTVISLLARTCCKETSTERPDRREILGSVISLSFIAAAGCSMYFALKDMPVVGNSFSLIGERGFDKVVVAIALLAASIGALAILRKDK